MRLTDVYDRIGEVTDERILSGSSFYVAPGDRRVRNRIAYLRKQGYEITALGSCRFRSTSDPISDTLRTDGKPFHNTPATQKERYRLSTRGFAFRRMHKGVFICIKRPKSLSLMTPKGQ